MPGRAPAAVALMLALALPGVAHSWGNDAQDEPSSVFDEPRFMWPFANDRAQLGANGVPDRIYFNAEVILWEAAPLPQLPGGRMPPLVLGAHALLGYWRDCNNDGYIGNRLTGQLHYHVATSGDAVDVAVCPAGSVFNPLTGLVPSNPAYNQIGPYIHEYVQVGSRRGSSIPLPNNIDDSSARVWGDLHRPDLPTNTSISDWLFTTEYSAPSPTLRLADALLFERDRPGPAGQGDSRSPEAAPLAASHVARVPPAGGAVRLAPGPCHADPAACGPVAGLVDPSVADALLALRVTLPVPKLKIANDFPFEPRPPFPSHQQHLTPWVASEYSQTTGAWFNRNRHVLNATEVRNSQYFTFYAHVGVVGTLGENGAVPAFHAPGATAYPGHGIVNGRATVPRFVYGEEACTSNHPQKNFWDCSNWPNGPFTRWANARDAWGAVLGQDYQLRDTDCLDLTTPAAEPQVGEAKANVNFLWDYAFSSAIEPVPEPIGNEFFHSYCQ